MYEALANGSGVLAIVKPNQPMKLTGPATYLGRSAAIVVFDRSGAGEMEIRQTRYVTTREEWRAWLTKHYQSETEVWLIYYKNHTGRPRIPYDHAVEEALCFGWVDSIVKRIDDEQFAQKSTPRRDYTRWSALNKRRLRKGRRASGGCEKPSRSWSKTRNSA